MRVTIHVDTEPIERERYTGRTLMAVPPERSPDEIYRYLANFQRAAPEAAGLNAAAFSDRTRVWPKLGAAVVDTPPGPIAAFAADALHRGDSARRHFEGVITAPEQFVYAPKPVRLPPDPIAPSSREVLDVLGVQDGHEGAVNVLVLDSGLEQEHPDFAGRPDQRRPFVPGELDVHDLTGHGTHCAGLACGPRTPARGQRYGVASGATLFAGRVMARATKSAVDAAVLDALAWAMTNDIAVVNMSFGSDVDFGDPFNRCFEAVAKRALNSGVLLVAAAGNDPIDARHPVEHPANCPSVMAVAALDGDLRPASFSCVARNRDQNVDVAAPGYLVRSAFRGDYGQLSGTSMAAALVSGVAALWAASNTTMRGQALWDCLIESAGMSRLAVKAAGAGLVQAPRLP